jgi:hypothetical protein
MAFENHNCGDSVGAGIPRSIRYRGAGARNTRPCEIM